MFMIKSLAMCLLGSKPHVQKCRWDQTQKNSPADDVREGDSVIQNDKNSEEW